MAESLWNRAVDTDALMADFEAGLESMLDATMGSLLPSTGALDPSTARNIARQTMRERFAAELARLSDTEALAAVAASVLAPAPAPPPPRPTELWEEQEEWGEMVEPPPEPVPEPPPVAQVPPPPPPAAPPPIAVKHVAYAPASGPHSNRLAHMMAQCREAEEESAQLRARVTAVLAAPPRRPPPPQPEGYAFADPSTPSEVYVPKGRIGGLMVEPEYKGREGDAPSSSWW